MMELLKAKVTHDVQLEYVLYLQTRKDTEIFIRDPEALAAALEALTHREETVRALVAALEGVAP